MAVTAYTRLRMLWGAFDETIAQQQTPGYTSAQIVTGGDSAAPASGVGVRRATIVFDRSAYTPAQDQMTMHFDFLNMTGGDPDDTWIASDYTTLETALTTFLTSVLGMWDGMTKVTQIQWHRVGSGVGSPNPAERVLTLTTPIAGSASASAQAAQVSSSITFRTGVRKSWGRTYLPFSKILSTSGKRLLTPDVDAICNAANTLLTNAASSDFHQVVVSAPLNSSLNVEHVEVDDVVDIIRRRRVRPQTYRKILP